MININKLFVMISLAAMVACNSGVKKASNSLDETKDCLVDYDWVYPSIGDPTGAWKFSADGTFNSSTTYFGGMSTWGEWKIISPGKINISYTKTTEGIIPKDQILTLKDCEILLVGSTSYTRQK